MWCDRVEGVVLAHLSRRQPGIIEFHHREYSSIMVVGEINVQPGEGDEVTWGGWRDCSHCTAAPPCYSVTSRTFQTIINTQTVEYTVNIGELNIYNKTNNRQIVEHSFWKLMETNGTSWKM